MIKLLVTILMSVLVMTAAACQMRHTVEVAPVEIKPIHITIDVNVRVDKALDNFFDDIDEAEQKIETSSGKTTR